MATQTDDSNDLQDMIGGQPFKAQPKGKAKPKAAPADSGFFPDLRHDVSAVADSASGDIDDARHFAAAVGDEVGHDNLPWNGNPLDVKPLSGDDGTPAPAKPKPKAKPAAAPAATGTPPASAAEQLLDGLSAQYQQAQSVVDPYISGSNEAANAGLAQQIGQGIGGAGVAGQNAASAEILNKDAGAYAQANDAGMQGINTALKDTGLADQQYLSVSPYLGLLNALTSEAQYKTETGTPTFSIAGAPKWLQNAYQQTIGQTAPGTSVPGVSTPGSSGSTPSTSPSSDTGDSLGTS